MKRYLKAGKQQRICTYNNLHSLQRILSFWSNLVVCFVHALVSQFQIHLNSMLISDLI